MIDRNSLVALVFSDKSIRTLADMSRDELTDLLGSDFARMLKYDQNNQHHRLNLLEHSIEVAVGITPDGLSRDEFLDLRIAALFHDIGKPLVMKKKNDRNVFYGHAESSMKLARILLPCYGFAQDKISRILFFIQFHDAFIPFQLVEELSLCSNPYLKEINHDNLSVALAGIVHDSRSEIGYLPKLRDFDLLLSRLCIADQNAQSEIVFSHGKVIDTREAKKKRIEAIINVLKGYTGIADNPILLKSETQIRTTSAIRNDIFRL